MIPNPALEPYDVIQVSYAELVELHVLSRIMIPLTYDRAMTGTTRVNTLTDIDESVS